MNLGEEIKKKILIMDDEEMVGEIACQMLEYLGFDSVWVDDGKKAIDAYTRQSATGAPFAAVVMDLTIPGGMGGKEAIGEILAIDAQAKVFVSSGYSTDPAMINFKEHGFAGVIAKPFDLASIKNMLDPLL